MEHWTRRQRVFIVEQYFKNNETSAATVCKFCTKYVWNIDLTSLTVKGVVEKFRKTGSIDDAKHAGRPITSRPNVNIEAVRKSVGGSPWASIWRLRLHAYKVQLAQKLKRNDRVQQREFVEWIIEYKQVDAVSSSEIILSDEAHFHLDGFVNRQICCIWG